MTDVHALSGAYAIDALDGDERAQFEEHLAGCADCRDEVAGLREAGAMLGLSAATTPPAGLRDRVLSDIAGVRPLPPQVAGVSDLDERRRRRGRRLGALAAAAAVVAVVSGGAAVWQPWADDDGGLSAVPSSTPDASTSPAPDPVEVAADRVLTAPDAETHAQALEIGGSATVARSRTLDEAVVVTEGLPALPRGEVYQSWLRVDGEMVPAGLMPRGGDTLVLEGDADRAEAIGITVEPAGGSRRPTSQPVAYFPLEQA